MVHRLVSKRPRILLFEHFLSHVECELLMGAAAPQLQQARVSGMAQDVVRRTASGCWLPRSDSAAALDVVRSIECRIAGVTGIALSHGEPCQLLRYSHAEYYSLHPDFYDPRDAMSLSNGGQRIATFIVYLSDVPLECGGATVFPHAAARGGVSVQPKAGRAILWHNTLPSGRPDLRSVHASEPVRRTHSYPEPEKWALSKWLRQRPFHVDPRAFSGSRR